jgi:hypothetical protein
MTKSKYIKINVSSTGVVRTRCKHCGKSVRFYSDFPRLTLLKTPPKEKEYSPHRYQMGFVDKCVVLDSTHNLVSMSYDPAIHKSHKNNYVSQKNNLTEQLYCDNCVKSKRSVQQKSVIYKRENVNRRGRYSYPFEVED